ncbi:hypothetical protein [Donghicola sp.]|jgi:hypothetical protein|uniref:hypothetical protein n=1 Tax=Donghicola sp. TaxID=1929294 RepID=UPI0025D92E08|nr:hypothetical protein [Donghicola sp.]MCT4576199.1 hypothetical protein [Donghicola sp.]
MVALNEKPGAQANGLPWESGDVHVEPTIWGYVVHCVSAGEKLMPVLRLATAILGIVVITMAVGLWFVPTRYLGEETLLVKLVTSGMGFYGGLMLVQAAQAVSRPEVQLDMQRREVRIIERSSRGATRLMACHSFSALSDIRVEEGELLAFDRSNEEVLRVRLNAVMDRAHIERRLRREVFGQRG